MALMDDSELLHRYLTERSEAAFAELVQRHLPLVYRAALRQTGGDPQADEISQAAFTLLARKALPAHTPDPGRLAPHDRLLHRIRRQARGPPTPLVRTGSLPHGRPPFRDTPPDWSRIQPVIDEVLQRLDARDRDAVLLRFFEDRPFAEIAARLDLKEDAARMRVNRALSRLRDLLASRGILSTEAALTALLAAEATAAPAAVPPAPALCSPLCLQKKL